MYRAEDPNNLHQVLPQRHVAGLNVERIQGYRYPAPGSRTGARIPTQEVEDLFDGNRFTQDPRNLPKKVSKVSLQLLNNARILYFLLICIIMFSSYTTNANSII